MKKIFLLDIDGCITPPNRASIDLDKIIKLQHYINKSSKDTNLPQLTIYTGRSQGYVELLAQMLHITSASWEIPFIVENGTALYYPKQKRFISLLEPSILNNLYTLKKNIYSKFSDNPVEPKENIITINPKENETIESLYSNIKNILQENSLLNKFTLTTSSSSVDILPNGYNKLYGIKYLLNRIIVSDISTIAIGDSQTDKEVLLYCTKAYIPSNANNTLKKEISKQHKNYILSQKEHIDATIEMIEIETLCKL